MEEDEEEQDNDNYPTFTEDGDTAVGEDETEEEPIVDEPIVDEHDDDFGRAILDAQINSGSENERLKLERMLEDHNKLLYPNCEDGQKKLVPHQNCCNGRQRMVLLTRDLKIC